MARTFYINFYPDGADGHGGPEAYAYSEAHTLAHPTAIHLEITIPDPQPTATVKVVG